MLTTFEKYKKKINDMVAIGPMAQYYYVALKYVSPTRIPLNQSAFAQNNWVWGAYSNMNISQMAFSTSEGIAYTIDNQSPTSGFGIWTAIAHQSMNGFVKNVHNALISPGEDWLPIKLKTGIEGLHEDEANSETVIKTIVDIESSCAAIVRESGFDQVIRNIIFDVGLGTACLAVRRRSRKVAFEHIELNNFTIDVDEKGDIKRVLVRRAIQSYDLEDYCDRVGIEYKDALKVLGQKQHLVINEFQSLEGGKYIYFVHTDAKEVLLDVKLKDPIFLVARWSTEYNNDYGLGPALLSVESFFQANLLSLALTRALTQDSNGIFAVNKRVPREALDMRNNLVEPIIITTQENNISDPPILPINITRQSTQVLYDTLNVLKSDIERNMLSGTPGDAMRFETATQVRMKNTGVAAEIASAASRFSHELLHPALDAILTTVMSSNPDLNKEWFTFEPRSPLKEGQTKDDIQDLFNNLSSVVQVSNPQVITQLINTEGLLQLIAKTNKYGAYVLKDAEQLQAEQEEAMAQQQAMQEQQMQQQGMM